MIDMLRAWIRKLQFLSMFKTLMAICYPIFLKLRRSIDVFIWLTIWLMFDICEIILFNYYWCYLCYRSTTRISLHHLSWTILFFHHGVRGIWIWSIWYLDIIWIWYLSYGIASGCIALHWHNELCREPMVPTVPVQHRLLGKTMQLHTLLGMKAGVHMHPCAYIIGLA